MRKITTILIGLLFVSSVVMGQNYTVPSINTPDDYGTIYYIDSDGTNGDGSIGSPFSSWANATKQTDAAYLFKAGTINEFSVSTANNNTYFGKYNTGDKPIIRGMAVSHNDVTVDSIDMFLAGAEKPSIVWQILYLNENIYPQNTTIANCLIKGLPNEIDGSYPHRNIIGKGDYLILYHNEISYSQDDGFYSFNYSNCTFVSNYFHHNNMGGLTDPNSAGDGIQFEHARSDNSYLANNFIDRQHTIWKFALIVNATDATQTNFVAEWNTFISPLVGNGGSGVRWYAGANNKLRKNLFNTNDGIPGVDGWPANLNQTSPNGMRDNLEFGPGKICNQSLDDATNIDFANESSYLNFMATTYSDSSTYGSDIDTSDFWGSGTTTTNPCATNPMGVTASIGNDTNSRGTGFIDITITGGYTGKTYLWSNTEVTEDISDLLAGNYSVTITDDSSCTAVENYTVSFIDTTTSEGGVDYLIIDTVYSNFEDGDNVATNTLDGDFSNRWSNPLDTAKIDYVLGDTVVVDSVNIAWYRGDLRIAYFSILISLDSINWTYVFSGSSSGDTLVYEAYDVNNAIAKYIRIEGYGNSDPISTVWTSITEFRALGDSASGCVAINQSAVIINEQNGGDDGSIDLTASGGSGTLSYLWTPGNTTSQDTSGLNTGAYTVVVTDDSSCTSTDIYNVYNDKTIGGGPADTTIVDSININFTQAGTTDGDWFNLTSAVDQTVDLGNGDTLFIDVFGAASIGSPGVTGSGPYPDNVMQYYWSTGDTIDFTFKLNDSSQYIYDIHAMSSRTYFNGFLRGDFILQNDTIIVLTEDNITPAIWSNRTLDENSEVNLRLEEFFDGNSPRVNAIVIYQKEITGGGTIVTYPIDATVEQTNVDCYGNATGALTVTPFNGVSPYTYLWNTTSTDSLITDLIAGEYSVTITDNVDSTVIKTYTITQNDSIYYETFVFNATNEQPLGHINITTISGGNGTYIIEWDNGSSVTSRTDLPPGGYWFIITDGLGCTTDTVNVTVANDECNTITLSAVSTNAPNGTLTLSVDPLPETDYTYAWSNGEYTQNLDSLDSGVYSVIVTDIYTACQALDTFQVANIPTIRRAAVINTGGKVRLNQNGKIITQ